MDSHDQGNEFVDKLVMDSFCAILLHKTDLFQFQVVVEQVFNLVCLRGDFKPVLALQLWCWVFEVQRYPLLQAIENLLPNAY